MAAWTLTHEELGIVSEDDLSIVRRRVRALAEQCGFDPFATAALTTATSELGRNALVHAHGGRATIDEVHRDDRAGIRVQFEDHGPGIADVERVLQGGFSTMRSLGLGLSGSRRLVDEFQLDTEVGRGTVVTIVKWKRAA